MKTVGRWVALPVLLTVAAQLTAPAASAAQEACPGASARDAEEGWSSYSAGDLVEARRLFEAALARCEGDAYARAGLGYVELREGDDSAARRLFESVLAHDSNDTDGLVGLALVAWRRDELEQARSRFGRVLELDPGNQTARDFLARIDERLPPSTPEGSSATGEDAQRAWLEGDTARARALYARRLEQDPADAVALHRLALMRAWRGEYHGSLALFDRLVELEPTNVDARIDRARVQAWAGRTEDARSAYEELLAGNPADIDARLGLATTLATSENLDAALAQYDRILAADPNDVRALRGKGRVLGWSNRLVEAERVLRQALAAAPSDAETLVVLGQILQWQGRLAEAEEVLERAVDLSPTSGDARQQLAGVRVALAPAARPTTVYERDSDGNRMLTTSLRVGFHPVPRLELRLDGYRRRLEQGALERVALGATLTAAYQTRPGWVLSGSGGWNRTNGTGTPSSAVLAAGIRSPERHPTVVGLAFGMGGLDETAALAERGVRYRSITASARLTPAPGWRVDGALGRFVLDGTEDNVRRSGSLSASKRVGPLSIGSGVRVFGYAKDLEDGYFDPDFYGIAEATTVWRHRPLPWSFVLEAAPGVQQVTRDGDPGFAFRGAVRVAHLVAAGRELALSYAYSSAGLLSLSSAAGEPGYEYSALTLALDWVF